MAIASATYLFNGMGDYFSGRSCNECQALLYAYYGKGTTTNDIVDQLVEDSWDNETIPADLTEESVRSALAEELGAPDNSVAECAEFYADVNDLNGCRECGERVGDEHSEDCAMVAGWREEGEWEEDESPEVLDEDCPEDDDCGESPVFIVLLEWEVCEDCGKVAELVENYLCEDCINASPTEPQCEDFTVSPCGALGGKSLLARVEVRFKPIEFSCDDDAIAAARAIMEEECYGADIWVIDDHGGCTMVDGGNALQS